MIYFIWTIILVWLFFKVSGSFFSASGKPGPGRSRIFSSGSEDSTSHTEGQNIKKAVRKSTDREGEYVDFEEMK